MLAVKVPILADVKWMVDDFVDVSSFNGFRDYRIEEALVRLS